MREIQLRDLFVSSLRSCHIHGNIFDGGTNYYVPEKLDIRYEYYYRSFDLVLVRILNDEGVGLHNLEKLEVSSQENVLFRNTLLSQVVRAEKSRIDRIRFYPVELKSDDDVLDARLPNQILNAILTFGKSIVVLDYNHSKRIQRNKVLNLFPCTFVAYTGEKDYFRMLYFYDRFLTNTFFDMPRRQVAKILYENGSSNKVGKMFKVLSMVQKINQKVIFNEMLNGDLRLSQEELEFIEKLSDYEMTSQKRELRNLIKSSINTQITEYF